MATMATMATIRTSAPGKLFLLGEYAVLDGAPALLIAVDRRVDVTIDESRSGYWQVSTPGLGIEGLLLDDEGRLPAGLDPRRRMQLRLFDAVREAVLSRVSRVPRPLMISIDSSALSRDGHKLGLGSSAAVASALTAGLARAAGLALNREAVCDLAMAAHRNAQDGAGSGGDVAASVYGGLIRYQRGTAPTPLSWPGELTIMAVVTGDGARTTDLVRRVTDYAKSDPSKYRDDVTRLTLLAEQAQRALSDPSLFLRLASDYFAALVVLDGHARAGIVSEFHLALHALAEREGGVFKPSGAGGGDVGLAFSHRGKPTERLAAALAQAGAEVVPLGFGAGGLQYGSGS